MIGKQPLMGAVPCVVMMLVSAVVWARPQHSPKPQQWHANVRIASTSQEYTPNASGRAKLSAVWSPSSGYYVGTVDLTCTGLIPNADCEILMYENEMWTGVAPTMSQTGGPPYYLYHTDSTGTVHVTGGVWSWLASLPWQIQVRQFANGYMSVVARNQTLPIGWHGKK